MSDDAFLSRFLALAAVVFALSGPVSAEGTELTTSDDSISFDLDDDAPSRGVEPATAWLEEWNEAARGFAVNGGDGDG